MKTPRPIFALIAVVLLAGYPARSSAATLTTLHSFLGGTEGTQPHGPLVQGSDGNLYGTTFAGGVFGAGTVLRINSLGTLTTKYSFSGNTDGAQPRGALIQASDGDFYGITFSGGLSSNAGTVFSINPAGTLTTLYRFTGGDDGANPAAGLVQGSDSNFYGTTFGGGSNGMGTVYRINAAGSLTTLYSFAGVPDGANPEAELVFGANNRLYGTTFGGGLSGLGTVFRISTAGTYTSLYSFTGGVDGANPAASLILGINSNFFGTTFGGGSGTGAVFRINATGSLTPLYNFTGGADGANPAGPLIQGSDGNFYGTTSTGGGNGVGTVFNMTPGGALTTLHTFGGFDGSSPETGLVQGGVSNYYGTTSAGGTDNAGTIFTLIQPCAYSLSPAHVTLPAIADSGTFSVNASTTNCPWTATNNVDWITITSGSSGAGDGTVSYSVTANPSANARAGTITVAGKTFTISQQAEVFGQFLGGTYNGLAIAGSPAQASSGFLTLVLGKTGAFQANLTIGGVRSAFKGQFDTSGNATNTVARKNLNSLQVILQLLNVTNQTDQITGTVSDGVFTSQLLADLAVFSKVNTCPFAGRYTFVLEPADDTDPSVPQGYGYGTLSVTTLGGGRMQGVLGDGTKITAAFPVSGYGTWPLYTSLYKKLGSCIGLVSIATNNTLAATVNWFKPAGSKGPDYSDGFTTAVTLAGAIYVPPADGGPSIAGSEELTLGGGNLESNLVKNIVIEANGNVTVSPTGDDQLKLKINPTTGQFSGGFLNPAVGKTSKLGGLLLQSDNSGAGFFQGTNQTGFVIFVPSP
jgi:uncharacterized repeat protein (TIGR03803 family)